jgi:alpha-aminoadipic semialdehyde synthase
VYILQFELLPVTMVNAEDLPALMEREKGKRQHTVYGCYLGPQHLARRKDGGAFSKAEYYENPSLYEGSFFDKIAPYTTVLVNGMYWDARFPRLLTTEQMGKLSANGRPTLRAIADITCDLGGSLEFCEESTNFENPYYEWDGAANKTTTVGDSERGVCVLAVDILPTALPSDASKFFGDRLLPILKDLLEAHKLGASSTSLLSKAMITHKKALTKNYQYIQRYREERERLERDTSRHLSNRPRRVVLVQGHLFDSKFINTAFDMAEKKGDFEIMDFMVVPNLASGPRESQVILGLSGEDEETVNSKCGF